MSPISSPGLHSLIPSLQVQGTCKQQIAPPPLSYPAQERNVVQILRQSQWGTYTVRLTLPRPPLQENKKNTEKVPFQKESS